MELTVGVIEDKLRQFQKGTVVALSCGCCHHGSMGHPSILNVIERSDYVELEFNAKISPKEELAQDKEEFYKKEIDRLKEIISKQEEMIAEYRQYANSIEFYANKQINIRMEDM